LKNIYVGNISYSSTEDNIKELFEQYGKVTSAKIIIDRYTQRSKGFGFVEMEDENEADEAINTINGIEFLGRNLKVNEAREKRY
jgi:RNA recognition motif-containing protein